MEAGSLAVLMGPPCAPGELLFFGTGVHRGPASSVGPLTQLPAERLAELAVLERACWVLMTGPVAFLLASVQKTSSPGYLEGGHLVDRWLARGEGGYQLSWPALFKGCPLACSSALHQFCACLSPSTEPWRTLPGMLVLCHYPLHPYTHTASQGLGRHCSAALAQNLGCLRPLSSVPWGW